MKKSLIFFIGCFFLLGASPEAQAQENLKLKLQYNPAIPAGSLKNYIDRTSLNGWSAELDLSIKKNWHTGLLLGFQDYYQKLPRQLYENGEQTISAVQTRSIQVVPVQVFGAYYFGEEGKVRPFARLAAGGGFVRNDLYWGQFNERENSFVFTASPGVGISVPVGQYKSSALLFGIQYNYVPYRYKEVENLNSVQANVGIAFPLR